MALGGLAALVAISSVQADPPTKGEPKGAPKGEPKGEPKGKPKGEPKGKPKGKPKGELSLLRFRGQQKLGNYPKQHEHDRNEKTHL